MGLEAETRATLAGATRAVALQGMFDVVGADADIAPRTTLAADECIPTLADALPPPLIRRWAIPLVSKGTRFVLETVDQPGRWMPEDRLQALQATLKRVASESMNGAVPAHYLFREGSARAALSNRVVSVVYVEGSLAPVAFSAMVYLPFDGDVVLHLGLTMISTKFRGRRLQSPLMARCLTVSMLNLLRVQSTITNIAGSPAGIGACSDYFLDMFPNYNTPDALPSAYHQSVAKHLLRNFRNEFACSGNASFDDTTFVVHGSNNPDGGGASEFIKADGSPVSQYKRSECNVFCADLLDLTRGDELFQVGRANMVLSWAKYMMSPLHSDRSA